MSKIDEELSELKGKMQDLKKKLAKSVKKKKVKDEDIMMLELNQRVLANQIKDWNVAFGKLAASPL